MKLHRVIIFSLCAMIVVLGLFLWLVWYDDVLDANLRPSILENAFGWVCVVALWPFFAAAAILNGDPPKWIYWLLLWIVSGLFWGLIIEFLFLRLRRRRLGSPLKE
jgi:putative copper export protein